ncbi:dihydrodipicolinate reductase [Ruegeria sp. WL0004]|uniref:Dihydrodipicolinate reductase n=1 Tax=Ruegeria marisflavi TaxID=2984152 RepID=A0ABT2WQ42_9RHOB|nr:dihydrodipicolinate reductase [Ruegeria sp. WL0004]MCU9836263.1 dihydrodipicolinate reductase [Ruegeria sp. WL0004]
MLPRIFLCSILFAAPAAAEYARVEDAQSFRALVAGKTLTRPLVRLEVTTDGEIRGTGAAWPVEGNWVWKDGYFCRDLIWGGSDLGYNCQEVRVSDGKIRFTSDRGAGEFADFRLRLD